MNTFTLMLPRGVGTLHPRTTGTMTTPTAPVPAPPRPPTIAPTEPDDSRRRPDGRRRPILIALVAVAVLGIIGSIVGVVRTERRDDQLAELTAANEQVLAAIESADAAIAAAETSLELVTDERDDLATRLGALTTTLSDRANDVAELRSDLAAVTADRDDLVATIVELDTTIAEQEATIAERGATIAERAAEIAERDAEIDDLAAEITTLTDRLVTVTDDRGGHRERNALIARFPVEVTTATAAAAFVDTYDVALTQVYCAGLPGCGTLPDLDGLAIRRTTGDNLQVVVPGMMTAGLYRTDGALFAIADTTTAVPACNGTARTARVAMTIHPSALQVDRDGRTHVTELGASLVIETDTVPGAGGCAAGLVVYGAELTPAS